MRLRPLRWSAVVVALALSYGVALRVSPTVPRRLVERFYPTLHAASWVLKASAINGTADGSVGPFKAPTGAGTVSTTGADVYLCAVSYYNAGHTLVAGDFDDVNHNTYTLLTEQGAAGDGASRLSWGYVLAPVTSGVEQWQIKAAGSGTTNTGNACYAFSGSNGAMSTVTSASSGTTSSTPTGGNVGAAGNLVVTAVGNYATGAASIGSSFNIDQNHAYTASNNMGIAIAWDNLVGGVAGAVNPQWTMTAGPTAVEVFNVSVTAGGGGGGPPGCKNGVLLLGAGC